jgi:hypothetical protein
MGPRSGLPNKEGTEMSEDEHVKITAHDDEQDEVEAHRHPHLDAHDEGGDKEGDEDFEAHHFKTNKPELD